MNSAWESNPDYTWCLRRPGGQEMLLSLLAAHFHKYTARKITFLDPWIKNQADGYQLKLFGHVFIGYLV